MTEPELVNQCKQADRSGQRQLYQTYVSEMTRLCYRYVRDDSETKDVLTEGFLKVFRLIGKFEYRGTGSLKAWIKRIMVNESLMYLRKQKVRYHEDIQGMEICISDDEIDKLDAEYIYEAILALPDGYRTVFNLYAIEGYSHKEIGERLGISESASRSQLTHARQKLKNHLKL